jgi:hypothetical protein
VAQEAVVFWVSKGSVFVKVMPNALRAKPAKRAFCALSKAAHAVEPSKSKAVRPVKAVKSSLPVFPFVRRLRRPRPRIARSVKAVLHNPLALRAWSAWKAPRAVFALNAVQRACLACMAGSVSVGEAASRNASVMRITNALRIVFVKNSTTKPLLVSAAILTAAPAVATAFATPIEARPAKPAPKIAAVPHPNAASVAVVSFLVEMVFVNAAKIAKTARKIAPVLVGKTARTGVVVSVGMGIVI